MFSNSELSDMLAGSSASMLSRIPCHPLDTCKARLQVRVRLLGEAPSSTAASTLARELKGTFRTEGFRGIYRGFGSAFWGSCPGGCLYFAGYEYSKTLLSSGRNINGKDASPVVHLTAGMLAEVFSCVLWVPIDVVKERLQTQSVLYGHKNMPYRGNLHAISTIARQEGFVGMYRGYGATVMSYGPFSGLYFMFYEQFKKLAFSMNNVDVKNPENLPIAPVLWFGCCGAAAGSVAGFLTNPLDLAKLRIQVQRSAMASSSSGGGGMQTPFLYRHMFDGISQIIAKEGFAALWKGALARVAFQAPATAISIASFEQFRMFYEKNVFASK
eukprot:g313.t1